MSKTLNGKSVGGACHYKIEESVVHSYFYSNYDSGYESEWVLTVFADHPDGPSAFIHPDRLGREYIEMQMFSSLKEAEARGKLWTADRRRKFLSHGDFRWIGIRDFVLKRRGTLVPTARKRYTRAFFKYDYPFAEMTLSSDDFTGGVTIEDCERLAEFRCVGLVEKPLREDFSLEDDFFDNIDRWMRNVRLRKYLASAPLPIFELYSAYLERENSIKFSDGESVDEEFDEELAED